MIRHSNEQIEERVLKIIRRELDVDPNQEILLVTPLEELDFDSLNMTDVILEIEQEYHVEIREKEMEYFLFVGDLVRYVQKKVEELEGEA